MKTIAVLDYGIGNVKSMINAFEKIGANTILTSDKEQILNADAFVLPGVGAFNKGMKNLSDFGLLNVIYDFVNTGKPFIGICLGMQMLLEESEEFGLTKGLGLIKGRVMKMPLSQKSAAKLPHISWNEVIQPSANSWKNTVLNEIPDRSDMYFIHTFVAVPLHKEDILALTHYAGVNFCSAIRRNNIYGTQFHPEKSGEGGLKILRNFVSLTDRR